jgi:hypothetical protein
MKYFIFVVALFLAITYLFKLDYSDNETIYLLAFSVAAYFLLNHIMYNLHHYSLDSLMEVSKEEMRENNDTNVLYSHNSYTPQIVIMKIQEKQSTDLKHKEIPQESIEVALGVSSDNNDVSQVAEKEFAGQANSNVPTYSNQFSFDTYSGSDSNFSLLESPMYPSKITMNTLNKAKCDSKCCNSGKGNTYSCDRGCLCLDKNQQGMLNSRGMNRQSVSDFSPYSEF